MYIDLSYDRTGHEHFAAYESVFGSDASGAYDALIKQVENNYSLGKAQISASLSNAKTAASASTANAKTAANATIKSAKIGAEATIKATQIRADVDRYGIDTTAATERDKIAQAREQMFKMGIPSMLIDAWTAQKNYEVAKQTLGLNIAQTVAQLRSTPDKYFMAADFEAVLPSLLNVDQAGGGQNGAVGASGTPNPQSLEGVVQALMGSTTTASGSNNDLFDQMKQMALGPATGTGTASSAYTAPGGTTADNGSFINALKSQGIQAWGHLPLDGTITQQDFNTWIDFFRKYATEIDPKDPRIVAAIDGAKAAGFDISPYTQWMQEKNPTPVAAPVTAAPVAMAPVAAGTTGNTSQLQPQDTTMLAGISGMMQGGGLDPFLLQKMDQTQLGVLSSGLSRLGYQPETEIQKALRKLPGQGDPMAA